MGRKHCGKRRNCSLRAISPFPQCFQKDCFLGASKGVIVWEWVKLHWSITGHSYYNQNIGDYLYIVNDLTRCATEFERCPLSYVIFNRKWQHESCYWCIWARMILLVNLDLRNVQNGFCNQTIALTNLVLFPFIYYLDAVTDILFIVTVLK